jgi:hypothetical protein
MFAKSSRRVIRVATKISSVFLQRSELAIEVYHGIVHAWSTGRLDVARFRKYFLGRI